MLQIRLNKGSSLDGVSVAKQLPVETVTVACPDHLVIADLPVAKGLGSATSASRVKIVGRRSRRQLGERVHFCVRCDFPIVVYGRLSPCEHTFCLDCARSDSICYLCDERIQRIQTIKMMEGIFICAAPHCLKSFLKKAEFESHIHGAHTDLLHPSSRKEELHRSDSFSGKQTPATSEPSVRNQASTSRQPGFPPPPAHMSPQPPPPNELQDRSRRGTQSREMTPLRPPPTQPRGNGGSIPSYYSQSSHPQPDLAQESGIQQRPPDMLGPQGRSGIHLNQNFDSLSEKQQQHGIFSDLSHYPSPAYYQQQAGMNPNLSGLGGPPPPFLGGRSPPFQSFRGGRLDSSAIETGSSSASGGRSGGPLGFFDVHPRPWSSGGGGQNMMMEGLHQGDNINAIGRNSFPLTPLQVPMMVSFNKVASEQRHHGGGGGGGSPTDPIGDPKGTFLSSMLPPPPGPPPSHILQQKQGIFFSEGMN